MKCKCRGKSHSAREGCVVSNSGEFGDICEACWLKCAFKGKQAKNKKFDGMNVLENCTHDNFPLGDVKGYKGKMIQTSVSIDEESGTSKTRYYCKKCRTIFRNETSDDIEEVKYI